MNKVAKFANLDGLRGLAALIVVFWHYSLAFTPFVDGWPSTKHMPHEHFIATTPAHLFLAGTFSVAVFFVLSGFVLSLSYFKYRTNEVLISSASRRYFRLMLPAFGSVLIAYAFMKFGLLHNQAAAQLTGSTWLGPIWNFPASLFTALYQGLFGAYFTGFSTYNTSMWSLQVELFGSFLVFMFLALFGKLDKRWFFYIVLALVLLKTYYLCFLTGMFIADGWMNRAAWKRFFTPLVSSATLIVGLLLGSWYTNLYPSFYSSIHFPFANDPELMTLAHSLGATCIILAVLNLSWLSRLLETRPFQFLGKISFSLYLLHLIFLGSLASYLFTKLLPHTGYIVDFVITFGVAGGFTIGAATLYARFVDMPSVAFAKAAGNWLTSSSKRPATIPEPVTDLVLQPAPAPAALGD